eukprot:COSAG06_NODE_411_length_16063_cov_12.216738_15_plen_189_part_00
MSAYSQRVGEVPSWESVAVSPPSSPPAHVHSSVVVAHDDALALASGSDGVGTFSQAAVGSAPGETRRQTRAAEPDGGAATAPRALRLLDAGSEDGGASRPPAAATILISTCILQSESLGWIYPAFPPRGAIRSLMKNGLGLLTRGIQPARAWARGFAGLLRPPSSFMTSSPRCAIRPVFHRAGQLEQF